MFTGDRSGDWLFKALHQSGFANQPNSDHRRDGLKLKDCVITAICHCAPPDNKPTTTELVTCRPFLDETIRMVKPRVFLALGSLAWKAIVKIAVESNWLENPKPQPKFGHGAKVRLMTENMDKKVRFSAQSDRWLVGSYHPSQQNTFTGRLTEKMFHQVFKDINRLLNAESK